MLQKLITLVKDLGSKVKAYLNKDNVAAKKEEVTQTINEQYEKAKELVDDVIPKVKEAVEVTKEKVAPITDAVNEKVKQAKCVIDEVATEMSQKVNVKKFTTEETDKLVAFFKEHNINGKVAKEKVAEIAEEMGKNIKSIATKFQHISKMDKKDK